ncbi:MAG: hypothetical protein ACYC7A_08020 [Thermoanaerobaculia bacterium]
MRRFFVFVGLLLLNAVTLMADIRCETTYTTLRDTLADPTLPGGIRIKVDTKVRNAWRSYLTEGKNGLKNAEQQLEVASHLLAANSSKQLAPSQREALASQIDELRACLAGAIPIDTGTAVITVVHAFSPPPVAGAIIRVDGVEYGVTGADGVATVTIPATEVGIEAIKYPTEVGFAQVSVPRGGTIQVQIELDEGKDVNEDSIAVIDEALDGVVPPDFASLTISFRKDEVPVSLRILDGAGIPDGISLDGEDLSELFRIENGRIRAVDVSELKRVIQTHGGKITLWLDAYDTERRRHTGLVHVVVGRNRVDCRLLAPPSQPALPLANISVHAATLDKSFMINVVSAQDGTVQFLSLPDGNVRFSCETVYEGKIYYGDATVELSGSTALRIVLRNLDDILQGVAPYYVETATTTADVAEEESATSRVLASTFMGPQEYGSCINYADGTCVKLKATAFLLPPGYPAQATAVLQVPQGTRTLEYGYWGVSAASVERAPLMEHYTLVVYQRAGDGGVDSRRLLDISDNFKTDRLYIGATGSLNVSQYTQSGATEFVIVGQVAKMVRHFGHPTLEARLALPCDPRTTPVCIESITRDVVAPRRVTPPLPSPPYAGRLDQPKYSTNG